MRELYAKRNRIAKKTNNEMKMLDNIFDIFDLSPIERKLKIDQKKSKI